MYSNIIVLAIVVCSTKSCFYKLQIHTNYNQTLFYVYLEYISNNCIYKSVVVSNHLYVTTCLSHGYIYTRTIQRSLSSSAAAIFFN